MSSLPSSFHLLAKPTGAICNLNCQYCYFLKKDRLYPESSFRMTDEVLESYIRQTIECNQGPEVAIAWQGGEPTLMGLDFFQKAIELQEKYRQPGTRIQNTLQTNGTLLDEAWCRFLKKHNFLVGLSLDGPKEFHDAYRRDKQGQPTFDRVQAAVELLQQHQVDFNILCTVNAANGDYPIETYRFFRDRIRAEYIQFIPLVERDNESGFQEGGRVTERSVKPEQLGRFLISIFDEWVRQDVGKVFVQQFDAALAAWFYGISSLCVFQPTCGSALALEHNGDLYSCDHYVEPDYLLGNILETSLSELVVSEKQQAFRAIKQQLPKYCQECQIKFACHGECPKNRIIRTSDGEEGLNYLCAGYKPFFLHIDHPMRTMAELLRRGLRADGVMGILAEEERRFKAVLAKDRTQCPLSLWKRQ